MSNVALPFTYVDMYREYYASLPRSLQIVRENATMFRDLDRIENVIGTEPFSEMYSEYARRHTEDLAQITNVYNDNVNYANQEIAKFVPFQKRTFAQYLEEHLDALKVLPDDAFKYYERDEQARIENFKKENFEVAELYQLESDFLILGAKIKRITSRLSSGSRFLQVSWLDPSIPIRSVEKCVHPENPPAFFNFKWLREVTPPPEDPKAPELVTLAIETYVAAPAETIEVPAAAAPKVDATVICNLGDGKTLAICCDPTWADQPIAFTPCESGWKGQVPVHQDWKFVILQGEKIISWEQGKNRRCNDQTQAFTVKANEVKF